MASIVAILVLIIIVLGAITYNNSASISAMRRKIDELETLLWAWREETPSKKATAPKNSAKVSAPEAVDLTSREKKVAAVVAKSSSEDEYSSFAKADEEWVEGENPQLTLREKFGSAIEEFSFENLIGGKLPIWVGGISLAFAGFFMVRYSIEAGLFGPQARVISATLFAFLLLGLSELGGKLPRLGASFSEDKRIAQSLAGAGIAVLYATLYMASELYGLIGVSTAFGLVVVVTVIAFAFSLRHGPPTAIMGVVGGFVAPWIAEMDAQNMQPLLAYLGVFIAALFGLSLWQRWLWLLLLAVGGGGLWTFALAISAESGLPFLGLFVMVVGGGAVFSALRFENSNPRYLQAAIYAPLMLAMVQLAILLPRLKFSLVGWAFVAALSVMSLMLAWRDRKLLPLAGIAALIAFFPLYSGWASSDYPGPTALASIGYGLLFGSFGHAWLVTRGKEVGWAMLAMLPPFSAYILAFLSGDILEFSDAVWAILALAVAAPIAWIAWQYRGTEHASSPISPLAAALTAILLTVSLLLVVPDRFYAASLILVAMLLAAWARVVDLRTVSRLSYVPLAIGIVAMLGSNWEVIHQMTETLSGLVVRLEYLPSIGDALAHTLLPALMMAAIAGHPRFLVGERGGRIAIIAGATGIAGFLWLLSRGVFEIDNAEDFKSYGFAERMMLTQLLALGGLALLWFAQRKENLFWNKSAWAMLAVAAFRFVIFDLVIFNPVTFPQAIGPAPIANLGVIHCVVLAIVFWLAGQWIENKGEGVLRFPKPVQGFGLGIAIVAALVAVRQLSHGSLIAIDSVGIGENYLYSVSLILLAIGWLMRGIMKTSKFLRVAGLGLLTAVTLKVFLIDAAALEGILRILSFFGLGIALIGLGWVYGWLMRRDKTASEVPA